MAELGSVEVVLTWLKDLGLRSDPVEWSWRRCWARFQIKNVSKVDSAREIQVKRSSLKAL